jgi:hypothetical protein
LPEGVTCVYHKQVVAYYEVLLQLGVDAKPNEPAAYYKVLLQRNGRLPRDAGLEPDHNMLEHVLEDDAASSDSSEPEQQLDLFADMDDDTVSHAHLLQGAVVPRCVADPNADHTPRGASSAAASRNSVSNNLGCMLGY